MIRRARKPYVVEKKGKLYYRKQWTENGKRKESYTALPGDEDSAEFDRVYWAIRSGRAPQMQRKVKTSWEELIAQYKDSTWYRKLKPGTRRKYDPVLSDILEKNGPKDVRKMDRSQVRAIHGKYADTPRQADLNVQVIRRLINFAIKEMEWMDRNPASGIELFGPQTSWKPWPEEAQKAYRNACASLEDEIALTFYMLGVGTGQRPDDCCMMKWDQYDGEFIEVMQEKTGELLWVACPQELRGYLNQLPKRGDYILAKNLRHPLGYDAVYKRFSAAREKAKKTCAGFVPHGWRFTAAVALAEAGCSDAQIQAVTGHRTLEMVQKYRARANQKELSRQAQAKRDGR